MSRTDGNEMKYFLDEKDIGTACAFYLKYHLKANIPNDGKGTFKWETDSEGHLRVIIETK